MSVGPSYLGSSNAAISSAPGTRVQLTRNNYRAARLDGHTANVVAVDARGSSMMVEREDGRRAQNSEFLFTRNNHAAKRVNGRTAEVVAIDPDEGLLVVRNKGGKHQTLDMANVADRYIRPAWVPTIHAAQGATCDRVLAHLESFRRNVDANLSYVAVSRAKKHAAIYTDNRASLTDALGFRDGSQVGAIDETLTRKGAAITIPKPVKTMGVAIG